MIAFFRPLRWLARRAARELGILLRSLPVRDPQSLALRNWHGKQPRGPRSNHVMHGMDGSDWTDGGGLGSGIFPYGVFELLRENSSILPPASTSPATISAAPRHE